MKMFKRFIPITTMLLLSSVSLAQPANDGCIGAQAVIDDGTCVTGTNVLANDSWTNLIGCQGGPGGPGGVHADVWYSFTATSSSLSVDVMAGLGWVGDIEVTLMSPDPILGCLGLFTQLASNCGPSPVNLSTTGLIPGNTYYIIVSGPQNGTEGQFDICTLTTAPPVTCTDNEDCGSAATVVLNPSALPGTAACIVDCNTGASPGIDFVGNICEDMLGPTVWYTFTTDAGAATIDILLTSGDFSTPEFTLWTNSCDPWTSIPGGCVEGAGGSASVTTLTISANTTYILAVSDDGGGQGNFNLCITQNLDASLCNTAAIISEASSSDPATPVGGPYSPGETVNFCYTIDPWLKEGCNWLSGIVPTFGSCWDPSSFDGAGMPVTTTALIVAGNEAGTWGWYPNGAVTYNAIVGSLPPGTPVGAGWFFQCNTCGVSSPDPNLSWGDGGAPGPGACDPAGNGFTWTVCFDLIAGPTGNCGTGDTDCSVQIKTYADGEIGGWTDIGCTGDVSDVFPASLLCCPAFTAHPDTTVCDSYTLPTITGTGLLGTEMYYDGPLGTGTSYVAGDVINYADYPGYPVTIYIYDLGSCAAELSFQLTIGETPVVTFTALADLCIDAGVQAGNGGGAPVGGVYSGTGVTDDGNGLTYSFDPAAAGVGVHVITYTVTTAEGCSSFATDNVEVFALPIVAFTALTDLCINAGVQTGLGGGTPGGAGGVYSGPGVTDDGNGLTYSFDPAVAGVGVHIITYTYTDGNGCAASATDNVEVFALPILTFTALADVCIDAGVQAGNGGAAATGGVYSGPGVTDDGNGLTYSFDPLAAGVGVHIITYSFTDVNGCSNTITDNVEVFALPILTFTALADVCIDAGVQAGNGGATAAGGVYSGLGVTDDGNGLTYSFDPATAGVGIHILTYTVTDINSCTNSITDNVEVFALPILTFTALADVCIDAGVQAGNGGATAAGGVYSGPGVTDDGNGLTYSFDPATAGVGIHILTYTFTDINSCTNSITDNVEVFALPILTFTAPTDLCEDAGVQAGNGGATPSGGAYSGTGVTDDGNGFTYSFDPLAAGIGSHIITYLYTDGSGCSNTITDNIEVLPAPSFTITVTQDPTACNGTDGFFTITGLDPSAVYTLTYLSGAVSVGPIAIVSDGAGSYIETGLGAGTYSNITITIGGCSYVQGPFSLMNPFAPIIDPLGPIVQCGGTYILPPIAGTSMVAPLYYDAPGGPLLGSGTVIPVGTEIAVNTILYMYDENGACFDQQTVSITINPPPTVTSVTGGGVYCAGATPANILVAVTGTLNWTVDFTIDGGPTISLSGATSPINLGNTPGVYVITGITDANCPNTAAGTQTIIVNPVPTVTSVIGGGTYCIGTVPADILVAVTGSTSWSIDYTLDGTPLTVTSAASPINLGSAPGVYIITGVTDANCPNTASGTQTIIVDPLPAVTNVSGGATYCGSGTIADILVDVTGAGGWTIDYTLDGAPMVATGAVSPINLGNAPGVYVITGVTDANCPNTASGVQTIIVNPLPAVINVSGGGMYCSGDILADILIDVTGSGTWAIAYTLDGTPATATGSSSPINLGNAPGVYVITGITDANCFDVAVGTQTIAVSPSPTVINVSGGATYCGSGAIADILVDVTGTGGWTIDYMLDGAPMTANGAVSPINLGNAPGVYVITGVTDANCPNTASGAQTIIVSPLPAVTNVSGGGTYCSGDIIADILVDVTGSGTWTVDYTLDGVPMTATGSSSPVNLGSAPGVYVITLITDANCSDVATGTQTIIVNLSPVLDPIADVSACDEYILPAITGTNIPGTENYYNNSQALGGTVLTGPLTISQTVYVYVDNGGCSDELSYVVTINATEDPTFSITNYCLGSPVLPVPTTLGGTFSFTIAVTDGATIDPLTGEIINGVGGTTYDISYFTGGICPATSSQDVTVYTIPNAPLIEGGGTFCENILVAPITATGGTGLISWFNSDPTVIPAPQSIGTGGSITPPITLGSTTYYVTEEENGCVSPPSSIDVIFEACDIIIPTAITPNGDTWNDDWEIINLDNVYPKNVVYIYNRWGNPVFESIPGDYNGKRWDGFFNGSMLPVGSYYYVVEFNDGATEGVNGIVSIIIEQ